MIKEIPYQDKDEWLSLRKGYIGGSDAGAVLGMNPYKSAYSLWAEKTGKIPEFEGNLITEVGSYLEEFVAKLFERETGKKVRRKNRMLVNDQYPFAHANVDRVVVGENAVLEIKTTNSLPAMKKLRCGDFPEQWYCQTIHYMAVGGFDHAYLAVLVNCREFKLFEVERDEGEIAALMRAEEVFYNEYIKKDIPPMADGAASTTEAISTIYAESNPGSEMQLFGYDTDLAEYLALATQIRRLKEQQDEVANKIKAHMGETEKASSDAYKVSWTSSKRETFDSKAFIAAHPNIDTSPYMKVTSSRAFKVYEIKKKQGVNHGTQI